MFHFHRSCPLIVKTNTPGILRHFSNGRNTWSSMFMPLTKDKLPPAGADASTSHFQLLKGGFVRQSSSGIYSFLPLGLRTIEKITKIIDEEMQAIGSQKVALPLLLSAENWKKTGRWNSSKGEFFRLKDRKDTDMLLSPTHEEEITQLIIGELRSPKLLPIRLYQIGQKYRDELRPRAGLLRGREFLMKDMYSFDASVEESYQCYDDVGKAYRNIFQRIGIPFVVAEADSGNIGGSKSHEYHLVSQAGEDNLLTCSSCGYTANEELAVGHITEESKDNRIDTETIENTANHLWDSLGLSDIKPSNTQLTFLKYTVFDKEGVENHKGSAAVMTRKGRSMNMIKIQSTLRKHLERQEAMKDGDMLDVVHTPDIENDGLQHVFVDDSVSHSFDSKHSNAVVVHGPDHYRTAQEGDRCASCGENHLNTVKAIEVAHTFYLGTKYSSVLGCEIRPTGSKEKAPVEMGCYGIGISRIMAAVAEARHDDRGIAWPSSIAPYRVCIVPTDDRKSEFRDVANRIYDDLEGAVHKSGRRCRSIFYDDVVIDDRRTGFGTKMKDAELIGYPFTVVVGQKTLDNNIVEVHERVQGADNIKTELPVDQLGEWLLERQCV